MAIRNHGYHEEQEPAGDVPPAGSVVFLEPNWLRLHRGNASVPLVISPLDGLPSTVDIDLSGITPDRLSGLENAAIRRLPIGVDGVVRPLAEVFTLAGSIDTDRIIECRGDFSRVHGIARGMGAGRIDVSGAVGDHAAVGMTGGELVVAGAAGDGLAAGMAGGVVHVGGDVGDDAGAALPGSQVGMTGGLVMIEGTAGRLAGARMRRGIVAIGGDCGPAAGFEMRAGTVIVVGTLGRHAGLGMRRGSIIAAGPAPRPPATFRVGETWTPPFLALLARRLAAAGFSRPLRASHRPPLTPQSPPSPPLPSAPWAAGCFQQWHGDMVTGGRGELFLRPPSA